MLLIITLIGICGCGKTSDTEAKSDSGKETSVDSTQPEPSFTLVQSSYTFECGSDPSSDIKDYIIADNYDSIIIKENVNEYNERWPVTSEILNKAFVSCTDRANIFPSTQKITLHDRQTDYEAVLTLVSKDTIMPAATVDHYEMIIYLKKLSLHYEQAVNGADYLDLKSYYNVEDKEDYELNIHYISIHPVNEMTTGAEQNFYVVYDDATPCSAIWEKTSDADDVYSSHNSFDLQFLAPDLTPGTYENSIIITDKGNNSISIPIKFCIIDDVDPQEREKVLTEGLKIIEE